MPTPIIVINRVSENGYGGTWTVATATANPQLHIREQSVFAMFPGNDQLEGATPYDLALNTAKRTARGIIPVYEVNLDGMPKNVGGQVIFKKSGPRVLPHTVKSVEGYGEYVTTVSSYVNGYAKHFGDFGIAHATGVGGTAVVWGKCGHAIADAPNGSAYAILDFGTATVGVGGCARVGNHGTIFIRYFPEGETVARVAVGTVDAGEILPRTWYVVRDGRLAVQH